jgi:hypothetical protein
VGKIYNDGPCTRLNGGSSRKRVATGGHSRANLAFRRPIQSANRVE